MTSSARSFQIDGLADCLLANSGELLSLTLRAARTGTWAWDVRTGESLWSPETWALHGVEGEPPEASFETWLALVHPEDRATARARTEAALRDGRDFQLQFRVVLPTGEIRWLCSRGRAVTNRFEGPLRMVGIVSDVTERVEAEAQIRFQEQQIAAIADSVPALMSYVDDEQRYQYNNGRYEEWFGIERNALVGRKVQDVVGAAAYGLIRAHIEAALAGERVRFQLQLPYSGVGLRDVDVHYIPHRLDARRVAGFFALIHDVTDLKDVERQLRTAHRQKDEFFAIVAHELRGPLMAIDAVQELLRRAPPQDLVSLGGVLQRQSRHLKRLVDDMIDSARLQLGKLELELEDVDVNALLARAVEASQPSLDARQQRLEAILLDQPASIHGDAMRLAQCVSNLLANAAKFQAPGGLVTLRASVEGSVVVISVQDNGIGFDEQTRQNMFHLLYQADRSRRAAGGLGIGLALAQSLIAMHGGTIDAESPGMGQGSTFRIRLPLSASFQPS